MDIIIHCVLKFGLNVAYIYGGHFVFVYPLFLGWLFHSYQKQPKILNFLVSVVLILCVYLAANNIPPMFNTPATARNASSKPQFK